MHMVESETRNKLTSSVRPPSAL